MDHAGEEQCVNPLQHAEGPNIETIKNLRLASTFSTGLTRSPETKTRTLTDTP